MPSAMRDFIPRSLLWTDSVSSCNRVAAFLGQVNARSVQAQLPAGDVANLQQLGLVTVLTADQMQQLRQEVGQLQQAQLQIAQERDQRTEAADRIADDTRKTHSVLFHLEGVDREHAVLERLDQEQSALKSVDADLAKRQQDFAQLLLKKSVLDLATPYDSSFIAITPVGRLALRDLNVALYRVGDAEFPVYWNQAKSIDDSLHAIANGAALVCQPLATSLANVDLSYLWAVSIGLVKEGGDPQQRLRSFLDAYGGVTPLSTNLENRLMSAEILSVLPTGVPDALANLKPILPQVGSLGIPHDSALGVASILLLGRRADGTYATDPLRQFLGVTRSYESAALLAVVNRPFDELVQQFQSIRSLFASWGYSSSEDTELSSAYLSLSQLPVETVRTKVAILARGISGYLAYPLVAAAILASIPVLEANETLNLLEKAYEILGQRTGPMSQAELISLAVRMVHGVDVRSVDELDPTRAKPPPAPAFSYAGYPPIFWVPVFVTHGVYYSTFSGIGGAHPGHVHAWGGGGFGGGLGGGAG